MGFLNGPLATVTKRLRNGGARQTKDKQHVDKAYPKTARLDKWLE